MCCISVIPVLLFLLQLSCNFGCAKLESIGLIFGFFVYYFGEQLV